MVLNAMGAEEHKKFEDFKQSLMEHIETETMNFMDDLQLVYPNMDINELLDDVEDAVNNFGSDIEEANEVNDNETEDYPEHSD